MVSTSKSVFLRLQQTSAHFKLFVGFLAPLWMVVILACIFDNDPVSDPNAFLDNLSQLLGVATGIIFTISTVAIAISSDRYSSLIFSQYIKDGKAWGALILITFVIIIATISIGLNEPMTEFNYWVMVLLFLYSVEALGYYGWHTLESLDPSSLAKSLKAKGSSEIQSIRRLPIEQQYDHTISSNKALNESIATLASLAIKTAEQRDELLAKHFVKTIGELQAEWIKATSESTNTSNFFEPYDKFKPPFCDEIERVFKQTNDSSENFKRQIIGIAVDLIYDLCIQVKAHKRLSSSLWWYKQFFRFLVLKKQDGRYHFLYTIRDVTEFQNNNYVATTASIFGELLGIVIQTKDNELFQAGLSFFTTARPSLTQSLLNLKFDLQQLCQSVDQSQYEFWYAYVQFVVNLQKPIITGDTKLIFEIVVNHLIRALPENVREDPYYTQLVEKDVQTLEVNKFFTDSVHKLCLQLFSKGNYNELARIWQYRGANSDDICWLPQDISFLTIQLPIVALRAQVYIPQNHQLPHHPEIYVYQYYFLCLAFLMHKQVSVNTFFPILHHQIVEQILLAEGEVADSLVRELRQRYIFLQNLPYHLKKVVDQIDNIIALSNKTLDKLFDNQFLSAVNNTKVWLESEELSTSIANEISSIKNHFPFHANIVQQYREQFENIYVPLNKRICSIQHPHYLLSETYHSRPTKTIFSRQHCLPKTIFTLLETNPNHKVLEVTSQIIHSIYENEYQFLISEIGLHNYISTSLNVLNKANFQQITSQLTDLYYTDYLILLLPRRDAIAIKQVIDGKIINNGGNQFWIVQSSSHLFPIFVQSLNSLQRKAYLFQPTAIQWTVHVKPTIALTSCPHNEANLRLGANGVVKCDIVFPKGIVEISYQRIETVEDQIISAL